MNADMNAIFQVAIEQAVKNVIAGQLAPLSDLINKHHEFLHELASKNDRLKNTVNTLDSALEDQRQRIVTLEHEVGVYRQRIVTLENEDRSNKVAFASMQNQINMILSRIEEINTGIQESVSVGAWDTLTMDVTKLQRKVNTLSSAMDKSDDEFTENVRQIAREVFDEETTKDDDDETSSVLDKDNEDARIRDIVADVLNEGLANAIADAFQNGALTISIDKV